MPRKKDPDDLPAGVVEAIKQDLAASKPREKGRIARIADRWGATTDAVMHYVQRDKFEINQLREATAQAGFQLAGHAMDEMQKDLLDEKKMAETSFRDKSVAVKNLVDSATVALEGHQPMMQTINFVQIKEAQSDIERYDRMMRERKAKLLAPIDV